MQREPPQKTGDELGFTGRESSSCSANSTSCVTRVKKSDQPNHDGNLITFEVMT